MMRNVVMMAGIILLLPIVFGCTVGEGSSSGVVGPVKIPNSLGFGSADDGVLVQFVGVDNDSRCAEGVQCVRAGEAFVTIQTTVDGNAPVESRLEMIPGGQATVTVERMTITLLELRPDPPPQGGIAQADYELILSIEEE